FRSSDGPAVAGSAEGGDGLLLLHARAWTPVEGRAVADGRPRIPRPAVRRVTGTITAADGRVLAVMTAACSIVAVTTAPGREPAVGTGAAAGTAATPGELATIPPTHPAATPSGAAADHPLLAMLAATVRVDGDRTWVRFHPEAWLADLVGAVHGGAGCAVADAAVSAALGSALPAGSATQVMSMDVTFIRSLPLDREVETAVEVRHVGRRLAVVDAEIGALGSRPSILARFLVSRTTLR
uniref:PaaI family thioesterase n=1 Tax=Frankia tisae TaxID=2950104 RepID=UPI0021BEA6CB